MRAGLQANRLAQTVDLAQKWGAAFKIQRTQAGDVDATSLCATVRFTERNR